jgi:hypothetical protein
MLTPLAGENDGGPFAGETVLQLAPRLDDGAIGRVVVAVAHAIVEAGGRALVACDGGALLPDLQALGAMAIDMRLETGNPLRMWLNSRRIARLIRTERVSLVHPRARGPAWSALSASRKTGAVFLTGWPGMSRDDERTAQFGAVIGEGERILVASKRERDWVETRFPTAIDRIRVVGRAIDLSLHDPALISPARVAAVKSGWQAAEGRPVLLAAFRTEKDGNAEALDSALQQAIAHGAPAPDIVDTASITDLPAALIAASGLVVLAPSPDRGERLVAEAQALGAPVIVLGAGAAADALLAPPETGPGQRTGWRVAASQDDGLALALAEMLSMRASLRGEMAERAARHASENFSMRRHVSATLTAYAECLAARSA